MRQLRCASKSPSFLRKQESYPFKQEFLKKSTFSTSKRFSDEIPIFAVGALLLLAIIPSLAMADTGYSNSSTPVITPSSSSQVIQPPQGSDSPNTGLLSGFRGRGGSAAVSPPSSDSGNDSNSNQNSKGTTGIESNPIKPRPDVKAPPAFKSRL